jgi:hypothetical protein
MRVFVLLFVHLSMHSAGFVTGDVRDVCRDLEIAESAEPTDPVQARPIRCCNAAKR